MNTKAKIVYEGLPQKHGELITYESNFLFMLTFQEVF